MKPELSRPSSSLIQLQLAEVKVYILLVELHYLFGLKQIFVQGIDWKLHYFLLFSPQVIYFDNSQLKTNAQRFQFFVSELKSSVVLCSFFYCAEKCGVYFRKFSIIQFYGQDIVCIHLYHLKIFFTKLQLNVNSNLKYKLKVTDIQSQGAHYEEVKIQLFRRCFVVVAVVVVYITVVVLIIMLLKFSYVEFNTSLSLIILLLLLYCC